MLTYFGVDRTPVYLAACDGRTPYQTEYAKWIAKRPNFAGFGLNPMCNKKQRKACTFIFNTKDGKMHIHRIGVDHILNTSTFAL
jgi:hypothetical protein